MGLVLQTFTNSLGETTHAIVKKGKSGHSNKLHVSVLIPLLETNVDNVPSNSVTTNMTESARPRRKAALASRVKTRLDLA